MKSRKMICFITTLGIMGSMLAGCNGTGKEVDTASTKVKDGKIPITVWYSGGKTAVGIFDSIMEDFNEYSDKYEVNGVTQGDYDETYEKLQAAIAGNNAPDVVLLDADKTHNLQNKELLECLDLFIEKDMTFHKEDFIDVFYNQGVNEGGDTFAVPIYGTTQVMYYNIDAFKKANVNANEIKTWQDLAEVARKITVKEGDKVSFYGWEPMYSEDNLMDIAFSNGGSVFSEDGKTVTINEKAWVEAWDSVRTWIHEEEIMRIHFGGQGWQYWYDTMDDVLQDRAGGYTGSSGDQADLDFTKVAAMEQPGFGENPSAPVARALQLVMPKNENEQEKQGGYEFMKFFTEAKNQATWSMQTGYVPVRKSTQEEAAYIAYTKEKPQALVPLSQSMHASVLPIDPTGGKVYDAIKIAADKVEIENVSAKDALDEAQKTAQKALDEYNRESEA